MRDRVRQSLELLNASRCDALTLLVSTVRTQHCYLYNCTSTVEQRLSHAHPLDQHCHHLVLATCREGLAPIIRLGLDVPMDFV